MAGGATKGDERRTALLAALDHQLRDNSLDEINIADISRRAGVTRSAFYFYFENKAAAVGALMTDMYDESWDAADLLGGDGSMHDRIEASIRTIMAGWGQRTHLWRALLDARAASTAVRDQYASFLDSFVGVVADVIEAERAAGVAPDGVDARAIARALLDLNDRTLERIVRAPEGIDLAPHVDAVVHIWLTAIYGSDS
ncbi:TetR/AcrR family transcriptional regulator [Nocardioides caricicola]|uniref:TetR/AcrR family transcriptional regulator n=1 Tax=Nocardioides caricicola TaxID=634770 RepID=A0ABW0MVR0_9ACTN